MRVAQLFRLYDDGVREALRTVPLRDRFAAWQFLRENRRANLLDICREFSQANDGPALEDDDGSDTPWLDFLQWLIESGKIQAFIRFIVDIVKELIGLFMMQRAT